MTAFPDVRLQEKLEEVSSGCVAIFDKETITLMNLRWCDLSVELAIEFR